MKYNAVVAGRLKCLQTKIKETKLTNDDVNLVQEVIPDANIWLDHEVNVSWAARSMEEVKATLKEFAERHVMLESFVESETTPVWYLKGVNVKIRLCPQWSMDGEGAACRLVKVGEDTIVTPKYKLVCDKEREV